MPESRRAERLSKLPPYLFAEIDRRKRNALAEGRDVIDFGVGDPDLPTPAFIIDRLADAARDPANHRYAEGRGMPAFRAAVAQFFTRRFRVNLDPDSEILPLLGSKEGIGHLATALINPGDVVLVPSPGYPVYTSGTIFAGGVPFVIPLTEESNWLPRLRDVPENVRSRARLLWLNYPNNPTGASASQAFFDEAIAFAKPHNLLIAQDAAYSEIAFGEPPASILQCHGARDVAVELHSLSKTFNMTGWRVGFAVGNAEALRALAQVKSNLDSGMFQAIQHAAIAALAGIDRPEVRRLIEIYRRRRDLLVGSLRECGWPIKPPQATFYLWAKCPHGCDSMTVAARLLDEADVVVVPGAGFGPAGEGFVRFALTVPEERTREAAARLKRIHW